MSALPTDTHGNPVQCSAHRADGPYRPARVDVYVVERGYRLSLTPAAAQLLGAQLISHAAVALQTLDQADDRPVLQAAQAALGVQIAHAETARRRAAR